MDKKIFDTRIYGILICALITFSLTAQTNSISIRTNAGIASSANLIDGYYFSFDIGLPITKYFELTPTFTGSSMAPKTFVSFYWQNDTGSPSYGVPSGGPKDVRFQGDIYTSIGCVLYFKPFELLNRPKTNKDELLIGFGYGYDSYTRTYATYEITENEYELVQFNQKSVNEFSPIFAKISYNRYFKEKAFYGIVASLNDFDGDGAIFLGFQLGSKL